MDIFAIRRHRLRSLINKIADGNISFFAAQFNYSRSQISQYLSKTYNDGRSIGERVARTIEERTSIANGWLDQHPQQNLQEGVSDDTGEMEEDFPFVLKPEDGQLIKRNLLVKGIILPKGEDVIQFKNPGDDFGSKYLEFHSRDPLAYALLVRGNKLRPRVKSGEFLVIEPSGEPLPGDDVVLRLQDGEFYVMQLLYQRGDEVAFGNLNEIGPPALVLEGEIVTMELITAIARTATLKTGSQDI
ncbi:S24 family peptidase [Janthinobacterium agaricidamnosum]|nr:S24 family peptidase [Janthinobacterium agaricidamnosum]